MQALAFELGHGQALMSQLSHAEEPLGVLGFETVKQSGWYSDGSSADGCSNVSSSTHNAKNEVSSHCNFSLASRLQQPVPDPPVERDSQQGQCAPSPNGRLTIGGHLPQAELPQTGTQVHADAHATVSAFNPGLASLQHQFRTLFGRSTNSTNVHWLQQRICSVLRAQMPLPPAAAPIAACAPAPAPSIATSIAPVPAPSPTYTSTPPPVPAPADTSPINFSVAPPPSVPKIKVVASTESKGKSCSKKRKAKTPEPTTPSKQARAASGIKLGTSSKTSSPQKKSRTYGQLMYVSAAPEAATSAGTDGPASDADDEVVDDEGKSKGKNHNPWYRFWTLEETQALVDGVDKCGGGKWADIKKLSFSAIDKRSAVDLKDKWRNLIRIAMLPAEQVKLDKKREATCPPELLQQVRDISKREELRKHNKVDGRMNRGRPRTTTETAAGH